MVKINSVLCVALNRSC